MALTNQASKLPTRKIMAVILSGMIVGGIQSALGIFWPDHPFAPYMEDMDIWIQGMIMVYAGYMTKEKKNDLDESGGVEEPTASSPDQLVLDLVQPEEKTGSKVGDGEQTPQAKGGAVK